ncbi:MAG: MarR family winged helix-turn-helix transcriptional regulator [Dehalococcoidia bacterium]
MGEMSSAGRTRGEQVAALGDAMRVFSSQSVLYTTAAADVLGMSLTDLLCAGILSVTGPITAGRLAELTGLTTGAITGVIDRMEKAGYARREPDPTDRRRVIVRLIPETLDRETAPVFAPMLAASAGVMASYSDQELATITDFVNRSIPILREETAQLRTAGTAHRFPEEAARRGPSKRGRRRAPAADDTVNAPQSG